MSANLFRQGLARNGARAILSAPSDWRSAELTDSRLVREQGVSAIIYDIAPPYGSNWKVWHHVRATANFQALPVVLTSPSARHLQPLAGSEPVYEVGNESDVAHAVRAILAAITRSEKAG